MPQPHTTPTVVTTITVRTDQGPLSLPTDSTLAEAVQQLLAAQGRSDDSVATAVNGQFVARGDRARHRLRDGDTVLCFSPITGG